MGIVHSARFYRERGWVEVRKRRLKGAIAHIVPCRHGDLLVASGEGLPARVGVYLGKHITPGSAPTATDQDLSVFGGATLPGGVFVGGAARPTGAPA